MTKRTNQTRTTIYRRHAGRCPIKGQPNNVTECECPLWIHGKVRGKFIRESLDTRKLSTAEMKRRDLEEDHDPTPGGNGPQLIGNRGPAGNETLEYAAREFLEATKGLATRTTTLYRRAIEQFCEYAAQQGIEGLRHVETAHVRGYFEAHPDWKRNTAQTHLTHLRVFFNYCRKTRRWLAYTPTEDRNLTRTNKSKTEGTRAPFTPGEIERIFAAVEQMPEDLRDRTRALVYLLLTTGMRISDATFCERSYVTKARNLDYYVIKTRRPITLPPGLLAPVMAALDKLPPTRVYFFQPDTDDDYAAARRGLRDGEEFGPLMPKYDARIAETTGLILRVLKLAGLPGACHRFRDTFAINMLVGDGGDKRADIYTVSKMLGHSDVKITDEHYMKLIPGYREKMSQSTRVLSYQFPKAS